MIAGDRRAASFAGIAALLAVLGAWTPASAHAPPQATGIISYDAGSSTARDWVRTNRGVILRGAPGDPLRLLCNDAYSASLSEVAPMIAVSDGLVVATYYGGILRIDSDGCSVESAEAPLTGRHVIDLDAAADGSTMWALLAPTLDQPGSVMVSADAGLTWEEAGEVSAFGSALRVAPSDANRLYITAQPESENGEALHEVLVSDDAGATFSPHPLTLLDSEVRSYVLGVDPTDAERVFVRTLHGYPSEPERLLLTEDGGMSFSEVASAVGPLVLAFDAEVLWLGGKDGLFRSEDGGLSFRSVPQAPTHIGCLSPANGSISVCGHQGLEYGVFEMSAGEADFRPALRFSEVTQQVACGDDAELVALCQSNFDDWLVEQASPTIGAAGTGTSGGGSAEPSPRARETSSCSFRSAGADASWTTALLWGLSLSWRRRAGRRRRK